MPEPIKARWPYSQRKERMTKPTKVDVKKMPKEVTLTVQIHETYQWRARKFIGLQLIKLATVIMGCGLKVEE